MFVWTDHISEDDLNELKSWGEDLFGVKDLPLVWRKKEHFLLTRFEGRLVNKIGVLTHRFIHQERAIRIIGVGGVMTHPNYEGKGLASRAMQEAQNIFFSKWSADCSLLFCFDRLVPFYEKLGWKMVPSPIVDQPNGEMQFPLCTLIYPVMGFEWPHGTINLSSLPW